MRRLLAAALVVVAASAGASAAAAAKVDVIVLKNGSRIVGEIKQMTKSRLELGTDDIGTLQIEWDNITEITAPEFFEVEHMNGGLYFGALKPGATADTLEIVADWGNDQLPLREIVRVQLV